MSKHSITDEGDLRKYYAAIPNIILTLGLNPFELALYVHFKQAAGDKGGVCWKSRATIAKESGMSAGMVTKARAALEKRRAELGGRPLITVKEEASKTGGKPTCLIQITDIWGANMTRYATSPHDGEIRATSPHDEQRHTVTIATSPHDHKEELLEEELFKNNKREVASVKPRSPHPAIQSMSDDEFFAYLEANPLYTGIDVRQLNQRMIMWCAVNNKRPTRRRLVNWLNREDKPMENGNGTHQQGTYQTPAQRGRAEGFRRMLAVVDELRPESSGRIDEVVCRKSLPPGR